jgi:hypothetical protein
LGKNSCTKAHGVDWRRRQASELFCFAIARLQKVNNWDKLLEKKSNISNFDDLVNNLLLLLLLLLPQ